MNTKIDKLEFNKILDILSSYSKTYIGKEHIENLKPMQAKKDIEKALKQVTEGTILLYRKGNIPLEEIVNPVEHIKKLNSNMFLTTKQLLDLANILKIASNLKEYFFIKLGKYISAGMLSNHSLFLLRLLSIESLYKYLTMLVIWSPLLSFTSFWLKLFADLIGLPTWSIKVIESSILLTTFSVG